MSRPRDWAAATRLLLSQMSVLDIWTFILPAISFIEITIIGRLFITEILLLVMLAWLWGSRDRPALPRWFLVLWAGWLLSQIVTDVFVGSAFRDLARGWAGIVFTLTNFAGIMVLVSTPKRARIFAFGLAVAGCLGLLLVPHPNAAADPWKWGLALPIGLVIAAGLSGRAGNRLPWLTVAFFVAFGALNLMLNYRSLGGISLLTAGYLSLSAVVGRRESAAHQTTLRAVLGLVFLAMAGLAVLGLYSAAASQGLLGSEAKSKYLLQAGAFGALLGGRPEALVSTQAILDSPILGHGSWAKDPTYAKLLAERQKALGYAVSAEYVGHKLDPCSFISVGCVGMGRRSRCSLLVGGRCECGVAFGEPLLPSSGSGTTPRLRCNAPAVGYRVFALRTHWSNRGSIRACTVSVGAPPACKDEGRHRVA